MQTADIHLSRAEETAFAHAATRKLSSVASGLERILLVHNRYQFSGGEDSVVRAELALLRTMGHEVEVLEEDNDSIVQWSGAAKAAFECVYSPAAARRTRRLIQSFRPGVMHVHNFFPRVSPAAHYTARELGVPVVQTLHNYRLLCPSSMLLREGRVCEECLGNAIPWPAVQHGCYRGSRLGSAVVAGMLSVHRALGTWESTVSRFIAPSEFARAKFIEGGLPAQRIAVKPHFVSSDPGLGRGAGGFALFVGRLSEEKGIRTLLETWKRTSMNTPLKIAGDGPLADEVRAAAATTPQIEWLGPRSRDEVQSLMSDAAVLVVPSVCYETFGMVVAEAFAAGLPVIASRPGAISELVIDGETGTLFPAGDDASFAEAVREILGDPIKRQAMRLSARRSFEERFTAQSNYSQLIEIYLQALSQCAR